LKQQQGDAKGALVDVNKAVELEPDSAALYKARGAMKIITGDSTGALADFNRAREFTSKNANASK
jgi:Flp pilus assembly protein TadD